MLPPVVMAELARLQDGLATFSSVDARAMVEAELGAPIDTIFSEFSAEPVAAASLAQVCSKIPLRRSASRPSFSIDMI